jgi:hypothetical protein
VITDAKGFDRTCDASDGSDRMQEATDRELGLVTLALGAAVADGDLSGTGQMKHIELTGLESVGAGVRPWIEG